ncbi:hypothetical protein HYFRA_00013620 [Hymenoscyphus fraxineus]|uniref:Uncharacterized protein n=1 Tax=Hymenoscyphus fraxineus TaxID=746836 RepID=A0A9N9Q235_9HELO|nr:hypothetical protein HYFRA_00013620 [Hymenoscyphus fraxineus]
MFTPPGALATPLQGMVWRDVCKAKKTHPPSEQKKKTHPLALHALQWGTQSTAASAAAAASEGGSAKAKQSKAKQKSQGGCKHPKALPPKVGSAKARGGVKEDIPARCFGMFTPPLQKKKQTSLPCALQWGDACSLARLLACAAAAHPSLALAEPWQERPLQWQSTGGVNIPALPPKVGSAKAREGGVNIPGMSSLTPPRSKAKQGWGGLGTHPSFASLGEEEELQQRSMA